MHKQGEARVKIGEDQLACPGSERRGSLGYFGVIDTYPGDPKWFNRAGGLHYFWFMGVAGLAVVSYCKRE